MPVGKVPGGTSAVPATPSQPAQPTKAPVEAAAPVPQQRSWLLGGRQAPVPASPPSEVATFEKAAFSLSRVVMNDAAAAVAATRGVIDLKRAQAVNVSDAAIDAARAPGPQRSEKVAMTLAGLAVDRGVHLPDDATRLARTNRLLDGFSAKDIAQVRQAYIAKYHSDPEMHIGSDAFGQPLKRLPPETELGMLRALNGPQMKEDAKALTKLLDDAQRGPLTPEARQQYYAMMPRMGLWDASARAGNAGVSADGAELDSSERTLLKEAFAGERPGVKLDDALKQIESAMPAADPIPRGADGKPVPPEKSIAVIASSHGAQWQELMDWAVKLHDQGYSMQVFTPEGRPVAFQRDSLGVGESTTRLGFAAPTRLDPAGHAGEVAAGLLGNAAKATQFDPKQFGAVYLAGGLGFNEDVAVATKVKDGIPTLASNPNINTFMQKAFNERLPIIAICHGPTLLASTKVSYANPDGTRRTESLNAGIATASLPPLEGYVSATGRKGPQFDLVDTPTEDELAATGGKSSVVKDVLDTSRVVHAVKKDPVGGDQIIITGAAPQAALGLAEMTTGALSEFAKQRAARGQ